MMENEKKEKKTKQSGLTGADMRCTSAEYNKKEKKKKKKTMQSSLAGARHAVHVGRVHEEGFDDFALSCFS